MNCDTSFNQPTLATAGVASSTAIQYTWDDFGNIVQVKNSGVDDPASSGTRYLYDAQGNVIEKQTAAMGSAYKQRFGYDGLGRLKRADSFQSSDGGVQVLYELDYDVQTGTPTGTLTNLKGRLSRRIDSYGDTWYAYDQAGRTTAEYRKRANCTTANRGVLCEPHTLYTWDKNGNLTRITYPYGREVNYDYGSGGNRDRVREVSALLYLSSPTTRNLLNKIAWEPYGGLRAYQFRLNGSVDRSVEYFLGKDSETDLAGTLCDDNVVGPPDGSGRLRGMFVGTAKLSLNANGHIAGNILSQRYRWLEDQVDRQKTCLGGTTGTGYQQDFSYDAMQRLTAETSTNTPRYIGDSPSSTRVFDSRGNRIDATKDGYNVWDFVYDTTTKDRLNTVGWWYGFLNYADYFVKYDATHNASGVVTKLEANKVGSDAKWTMDLGYSSTRALSDVFTSVTMNNNLVYDYFYDAFGRRRMKRDAFNNGTEFTYDLGHQMLVDQSWSDTNGVGSDLDEYVWLDGRPVVAFRGKVNGTGAHVTEALESPPSLSCNRLDEAGGDVHCGAFHLVSNQQNFVMLAVSDYDGKVASFALPDADGQINRPRFVHFGGYGSGHAQTFDVPSTFSKQARFRTVYTGGWNTDYWGNWGGITEMRLTVGASYTGITPNGGEYGRVVGPWSPTTGGTQNVTWSTVCSTNCASATDMLEWRVWETGAPRFNTRLRFPGQYHDAETDFYENWNRFYDPTTARYLTSEPLAHEANWLRTATSAGLSMPYYSYASNNPVRFVDFDGNQTSPVRPNGKKGPAKKPLKPSPKPKPPSKPIEDEDLTPIEWCPGGTALATPPVDGCPAFKSVCKSPEELKNKSPEDRCGMCAENIASQCKVSNSRARSFCPDCWPSEPMSCR